MKRGLERSPSPRGGRWFERIPRKYDDMGRDSRPFGGGGRDNYPYRGDGGRGGGGYQMSSSRPGGYRNDRPDRPPWGDEKQERQTDFKTLFVGNLNQQVPDPQLKDALYKEFDKFGEFNVKLSYNGDEKVAYVCFRRPEDAKEAKRARLRAMLFDRPIYIDYATVSISARRRTPSPDHRKFRGRSPFGGGVHRGPGDFKPRGDHRPSGEHGILPRKDRFPDYMTHLDPADDPDATRTLFIGNIDSSISEDELLNLFQKYGYVEDIDMKRHGTGNPYAFVRFHDLDMAHDAKINLSGKYIGKFQLKIGFGKCHASNMIWLGGLSSAITVKDLDREFARYGKILDIEMRRGSTQAHVLFEDTEAAKEAFNKMRGNSIAGHKIRIDFNESYKFGKPDPPIPSSNRPSTLLDDDRNGSHRQDRGRDATYERGDRRGPDDRERGPDRDRDLGGRDPPPGSPRRRRSSSPGRTDAKRRFPSEDDNRNGKRERRDEDRERRREPSGVRIPPVPHDVRTLDSLAKHLATVSDGALILKSSAFLVRFHLLMGDEQKVRATFDGLSGEPRGPRHLKITQRLKLEPTKLDDMNNKIYNSGSSGNAVLLAMPDPDVVINDPSVNAKRPLRNLMGYLKQKEAAGVIQSSSAGGQCVLHAFPACDFAHSFLKKVAPGLGEELPSEEHLVILLTTGNVVP